MTDAASDGFDDGYGACLLELRARVEALEADQWLRQHAKPKPEPEPEPAVAGSLVERVAIACAKPCNETWDDQARAAIREVAEWLREEGYPSSPSRLEREVEQ